MAENRVIGFLRRTQSFSSLKSAGFFFYFLAMIAQTGVTSVTVIAQSLLVYRLTGSAVALGIMALASSIPIVLLSLIGGAAAERISKKKLIATGQFIFIITNLVLALALTTGFISAEHTGSWWIIVAVSFCQNIVWAITSSSQQSVITELVMRNKFMNALSIHNIGNSAFQIVFSLVGGIMIDTIKFSGTYYVLTGLAAFSFLFLIFMKVNPQVYYSPKKMHNTVEDIKSGLKYVAKSPGILALLIISMATLFTTIPQITLMPIFTDKILNVGATGFGLLTAVANGGALVMSIFLATVRSSNLGIWFLLACFAWAAALVVFAFSTSWPLVIGIMVIIGFIRTVHQAASVTLLQQESESGHLSSVMSVMSVGFGISGVGGFAAGYLADRVGAQWAVACFGIALGLLAFFLILMPGRKKMQHDVP